MNHVMAVLNPDQRHDLIEKVRRNYQLRAMNEDNDTTVVQDRINRVMIYEGTGDNKRLAQSITVVVTPVVFNIEPLLDMSGPNVKFSIHIVLDEIEKLKKRLQELQSNPSKEHVGRNRLELMLKAHSLDGLGSGGKTA